MNDPEFISLLNLYVDREINPEDALRLEAEVVANPKRREIYDQYCRMQKACALLATRPLEENLRRSRATALAFPRSTSFGWGSAFGGLAAAAVCAFFIVGYKLHRADTLQRQAVAAAVSPAVGSETRVATSAPTALKPVTVLQLFDAAGNRPVFAADHASGIDELNWMQAINMPPVFTPASPELLKTDVKAAANLVGAPTTPAATEAAETTAFRFQR